VPWSSSLRCQHVGGLGGAPAALNSPSCASPCGRLFFVARLTSGWRGWHAAYDILSNVEKRKAFDRGGEEGLKQHDQRAQQGGGNQQHDMFSQFFGGGTARSLSPSLHPSCTQRSSDACASYAFMGRRGA
jgi:hypothetical protein